MMGTAALGCGWTEPVTWPAAALAEGAHSNTIVLLLEDRTRVTVALVVPISTLSFATNF